MQLDHNETKEKYVDYVIATQYAWTINGKFRI